MLPGAAGSVLCSGARPAAGGPGAVLDGRSGRSTPLASISFLLWEQMSDVLVGDFHRNRERLPLVSIPLTVLWGPVRGRRT